MTTTAERVVETLAALGVDRVFGYPGGRVIELFEALSAGRAGDLAADPERVPDLVRPRDEREASVMAEAHGRLTGRPAVLAGQGPWIGSLGGIGQMEARLGSTPMVVITEASERGDYSTLAPYQQARGDYGGLDLPSILEGVTKEHWLPRSPAETVRSVQLAFKHAVAGRPGPCAVVLDGDAVTEEVPADPTPPLWEDRAQTRTWHGRPTHEDVRAAARAMAEADRPVVLAGNGVRAADAGDELLAVAEAYDAVVCTSYLGKSAVAETHDRAAGVVGSFGHEGANRAVSEADALLVVGCRLNPMDTNWQAPSFVRPEEQTILQVDVDPRNAGWVYPADVGLVGDARPALAAIAGAADRAGGGGASGDDTDGGATGDGGRRHRSDWSAHGYDDAGARAAAAREDFSVPECDSEATPIPPQRVAAAVESVVDEDTVVTADSGNNRFWLLNYLQAPARDTYVGSGGVGAMGWAPPAAVAAALLGRDAICVAGDGGFGMTMTAVETAVDRGVAPAFVVMNDTSLGMVRQMDESGDSGERGGPDDPDGTDDSDDSDDPDDRDDPDGRSDPDGRDDGGMPGVEFHDTDFVGAVEAMGGRGTRVADPGELDAAVEDAVAADRPTVVDVRIDRDEQMADQLRSSFYAEVGGLHE